MKNRSGEKIKLASIDELLGVVNEESAMEIEISKIHPFKNHPFKVLDDEKMQDLVESVKINGVLTPVLLRMDENEEYEMVSGHRRMHAVLVAGIQYSDNLSSSLFGVMAYTVILCYSLFKTASLSKSIFNAH